MHIKEIEFRQAFETLIQKGLIEKLGEDNDLYRATELGKKIYLQIDSDPDIRN
jgi:hypothetical protein